MPSVAFTAKEDWVKTLELHSHAEDGYFCETYRSMQQLISAAKEFLF